MAPKLAVMFGGGGALGAFGCGAWKALSARLEGAELIGAGGTSIGAINAAHVVRQGGDLAAGARAMEAMWREDFATPSFPFAGAPMDRMSRSWSGFLTSLFLGTRGLCLPDHGHWNPWMGLDRFSYPLMDRRQMWNELATRLGCFQAATPQDPLLAAAAVDIMRGELRLFDSAQGVLDIRHLNASAAIPLLFEPVSIDDRLYWDGDITRQAALPLFLQALRRTGRLAQDEHTDATTVLVTIDQMSEQASKPPTSGVEISFRVLELLMHGKMSLTPHEARGISHIVAIQRPPLDHDAVSGQLDYSPERIDELIELGMAQALRAWDQAMSSPVAGPMALRA